MTDTRTLLHDYAANGSHSAFREIVERYVNLVYSTALRMLDGDIPLTQDVVQTVFIDLARHAGQLSSEVMVGGWLHRRTCHVAASVRRSERRRKTRERIAVELHSLQHDTAVHMARIAPVLDEAINRLAAADRTAIVLRFYEQRDFRKVAEALGTKEDAARMRVNRALEKLHRVLSREGIDLPAAALGVALATGAVSAAPAGLAPVIAGTALASATAATSVSLSFVQWLLMSKLKTGIIGALVVGTVAAPLAYHSQSVGRMRDENQSIRRRLEEASQWASENARLSNMLSQVSAAQASARNQQSELLKLRGDVGLLRKQLAEASQARAALEASLQAATQQPDDPREDSVQQEALAKMGYAQHWLMAFYSYANNNQDQFPSNFQVASSFLPDTAREGTLLATNQFEILYQGSLQAITNPASAIVLRETQPFQGPHGEWLRTYGFADGHTEVHRADDGNFEPWEARHMPLHAPVGSGR
jgi:RNA polymerase sigma factor (sigma-70 family)